jgi:hypothetical protein
VPQVQVVNVGKPEDLERKYAEKIKALEESVNMMQDLRIAEQREAECRQFVEGLSTEKNHRIPAAKKEAAVYLLMHAPNGQTRHFSEGGKDLDYAAALREFMSGMPDQSHLFARKTIHMSSPTSPGAKDIADKAQKIASEKQLNFSDALEIVKAEIGEEAYTDAVHGGGN